MFQPEAIYGVGLWNWFSLYAL